MQETSLEYAFSGMKGVDGFMKRMRLKMWKPLYISPKGMVYPLALWTNKEVLQYIQNRNLIKPFSYANKNKTSQGLELGYDQLSFLKTHYPNDYKKILQEYPYADLVLHRHSEN